MKQVQVAVGVILRGQQVFISQRANKLHQGGKWEFPGGKQEAGESMSQALVRELREEVGIDVLAEQPLMTIEHDYGDKKVRLDVRLITHFAGEPAHKEGQITRWVAIKDLAEYSFPDANQAIIERLAIFH